MSIRELPVVAAPEGIVLFPGVVASIELSGESAVRLVADVVAGGARRLIVAARLPGAADTDPPATIAVEAEVVRVMRRNERHSSLLVRGRERVSLGQVVRRAPYLVMSYESAPDTGAFGVEVEALALAVRDLSKQLIALSPDIPDEAAAVVDQLDSPSALADAAAAHIDMPATERLKLLETLDVGARLRALVPLLGRAVEVLKVKQKIDSQVEKDIGKSQREYVLRQKLKAIQEELGEGEDAEGELDTLKKRLADAKLPEEAQKVATAQLARLEQMGPGSPEQQITRTYLEWIADLPWSVKSDDRIDLAEARAVLDADHHGLEKVKKRVVEFLAVRKLAPRKHGPILCLVGPPGVGKTSLGRSIATTMGRKYVRASLGGVSDEAEIRGHRRTYVGALPGRIIQGLKRAGAKNPVFVLDEVDKLGSDFRGDPSSALLEVLDPEQNSTFSDHYLEVPFDLSEVMFIATANRLDTIPAPLRDRMEIIEVPGYTRREKLEIAKKHLLPRQLAEHGIDAGTMPFDDDAIDAIIDGYTREAGVRNLERELGAVCRARAVDVAVGRVPAPVRDAADVEAILGPARFEHDLADRGSEPGVTTGLAWTPAGGEVLVIESSRMPGHGKVTLTGQLGDVMKESAQAAMSYARAHAGELGIDPGVFERSDVHIHLPAGAVPKDGPSAGVALLTTVVSLLTGRRVRADVAMTGEVTLRGRVLPVGGIKEKVLAAHRAGVHTVYLPERNRKDASDIPDDVRAALDIRFVGTVGDVLSSALEPVAAVALVPLPALQIPVGPTVHAA